MYGEGGNDDIYGGHNIDFGDDTGDELSGGLDEDSILGDNGQIVRQLVTSSSEFPWLNGMVWLKYTEPFDTEVVREIRRYDDVDEIGVRKTCQLLDMLTNYTAGSSLHGVGLSGRR